MIFRSSSQSFYTEFEAVLIEEALLLRFDAHPEERIFRSERNPIYELADAEQREKRFRDLHAQWFVRLGLGRPILEALSEYPSILRAVRSCRVSATVGAEPETADLHDLYDSRGQEEGPHTVVLLRIRPARLLEAAGLRAWLSHELMHIADMVDPDFGYQRAFPPAEGGPAYANRVRERYRILWDTWIDGRLFRRTKLGEPAREQRREEFLRAFARRGTDAESEFSRLFASERETHAGLLTLASEPGEPLALPAENDRPASARICPLCRFPCFDWLDGSSQPVLGLEGDIRSDFPNWHPSDGLCQQCADLYRARQAAILG